MQSVEVKNVVKNFSGYSALKAVNFSLSQGEQVALKGASGSGKSTLLYLLAGMDRPTSGQIVVAGNPIEQMSDQDLSYFRNRHVGLVFQFPFLLPAMNCLDNILLPAHIAQTQKKENIAKIQKEVLELAQFLGVQKTLMKYPYQLSGGEQQRINIIRALSMHPRLLLCDEPTGNLDSENGQKVTSLLKQLAKDFDATLILVTHDDDVASQLERVLTIKDGHLE